MHRFLLSLAILSITAAGGWFGWKWFEQERIIADQRRIIASLEEKLDRLWAAEMVADLRVDDVGLDTMTVTFVQYQPGSEQPVFKRTMTLPGRELYVDALVVKFERSFVEAGDGLRGKSIFFFRRAFGDNQKPIDGVPLFASDNGMLIPELARVDAIPSEFEREIWTRFWEYANDPSKAKEAGILVAQGEAPHVEVVKRQVYKLTLRPNGGLEITPRLPAALVGEN
jgi:hypothetical protein